MRRRRRDGFGWTPERHIDQAEMYISEADRHLGQVQSQFNMGFCLTALEAFQGAADAVGAAAAALDAAEISPGSHKGWFDVHVKLRTARKTIASGCMGAAVRDRLARQGRGGR